MIDSEPGRKLVLELPQDPAHLAIARLFAGSTARIFGVAEADARDVKTAVSEACLLVLAGASPVDGAAVEIRVTPAVGELAFEVRRRGDASTAPPQTGPDVYEPTDLARQIILGLFEEADIASDGSWTTKVTFRVPATMAGR